MLTAIAFSCLMFNEASIKASSIKTCKFSACVKPLFISLRANSSPFFAIETELGIPVKLVGIGEGAHDLVEFVPSEFIAALFE